MLCQLKFIGRYFTCSVGHEHSIVIMKMAWDLEECSFILVELTDLKEKFLSLAHFFYFENLKKFRPICISNTHHSFYFRSTFADKRCQVLNVYTCIGSFTEIQSFC